MTRELDARPYNRSNLPRSRWCVRRQIKASVFSPWQFALGDALAPLKGIINRVARSLAARPSVYARARARLCVYINLGEYFCVFSQGVSTSPSSYN